MGSTPLVIGLGGDWQRNPDFTREPSTSRDASIPSAIKSMRET